MSSEGKVDASAIIISIVSLIGIIIIAATSFAGLYYPGYGNRYSYLVEKAKLDIIQDPTQLFQILKDLLQWSIENQFYPYDVIKSPILCKEVSIEFFIYLKLKKPNLNLDFNYRIKEILKLNPYIE